MTPAEVLAEIRSRAADDHTLALAVLDEVIDRIARLHEHAHRYVNGGGRSPEYWAGMDNAADLVEETIFNAADLWPEGAQAS